MRTLPTLLIALLMTAHLAAQEAPKDLGDRVRDVFIAKCGECHSMNVRKPKGGFGYVEDMKRVVAEYSKTTDFEDNDIWYYLVEADEDEIMPPEKSKAGPLSTDELALVRWWIAAGSPVPSQPLKKAAEGEGETETKLEEDGPEAGEAAAEKPAVAETGTNLVAAFHPVLVHFPIALIIVALLFEFLKAGSGSAWQDAVRLLVLLAILSAVLSGISGFQAQDVEGYSDDTVAWHQWSGIAGTILALAAWMVARKHGATGTAAFRILLLLAAVLIGFAGHEGGLLVYGPDHFG